MNPRFNILRQVRFLMSLLPLLWHSCLHAQLSNVAADQEILLFPTIAYPAAIGKGWEIEVHGCVYEEVKHRLAIGLLLEALHFDHVKLSPAQNQLFVKRSRLFMVDHERGRTVVVRVGDKTVKLSKSRPDGQFFGTFHLSQDAITNRDAITLTLTAVLRTNDLRVFAGEVNLLGETGITVISDIDDTIKDTRVQDRNAALRSTFLEPFKAVPGMARVYQHWRRDSDAHFIYVSASPWQLYLPLTDFIRSEGFPPGPFYLKDFRWKDQTFFNLFQSPVKYKPKVIEPILKRFPNRRFILVGDSGESDPEIYGELARKFPVQISRILIREVTTDPGKKERYAAAFLHVPDKIWKVFDQPAEIENAIAESRQF